MSDTMGDGFLKILVDGKLVDDMWYAADTEEIKEHGYNVAKLLYNLMENGVLKDFTVSAHKDGRKDSVAIFTPDSIEAKDGYTQWYT